MNSGVYEILNTTNSKRYVGSAVNLRKRKRNHWRMLRGNCHHSRYLQNAWNKYGENAFEFGVIEYWEPEFLISFEQWWMNMLQPEYNILPVAGSSLGMRCSEETKAKIGAASTGRKHSTKTRAKISAAKKGRKLTTEHKANISAAGLGRKNTPETRAKMSASQEGRKHPVAVRVKMSAAKKGKPWTAARRAAQEAKKPPYSKGEKQ